MSDYVVMKDSTGKALTRNGKLLMHPPVIRGTDVFVGGQRQDRLDFTSDPQEQLYAKQDKLSQAQLQAIGEVDAVKSIALQNQSDVTLLASKVETNTSEINKKLNGEYLEFNGQKVNINLKSRRVLLLDIGGTPSVFNFTINGKDINNQLNSGLNIISFSGDIYSINNKPTTIAYQDSINILSEKTLYAFAFILRR